MQHNASLLLVAERFYAAALGLSDWDAALTGLSGAVGADHVILRGTASRPFMAAIGVDAAALAQSLLASRDVAYDGPPLTLRPGEAVLASQLMDENEYRRTAYYCEVIRPLRGFHGIWSATTEAAPGASLAICRAPGRDDFQAGDLATVCDLLPHLSLAMAVAERVVSSDAGAMIEAFNNAVLLCDRDARPVLANAASLRLMDEDDGLVLEARGVLASSSQPDSRSLRSAIVAVASGSGPRRVTLARRSGRPALGVRLMPVRGGELVAVFVSDPGQPPAIEAAALRDAFGLTGREAEIAVRLAGGASVDAIARATGLQVASVRSYLKRVFDKTGVHSQSALVALVRDYR